MRCHASKPIPFAQEGFLRVSSVLKNVVSFRLQGRWVVSRTVQATADSNRIHCVVKDLSASGKPLVDAWLKADARCASRRGL